MTIRLSFIQSTSFESPSPDDATDATDATDVAPLLYEKPTRTEERKRHYYTPRVGKRRPTKEQEKKNNNVDTINTYPYFRPHPDHFKQELMFFPYNPSNNGLKHPKYLQKISFQAQYEKYVTLQELSKGLH